MEAQEEKSILNNANFNTHPITTKIGTGIIGLAILMAIFLWLVPIFIEVKQEPPYDWRHVLGMFVIGFIVLYMNDQYFGRLFNIAEAFAKKKTGTDNTPPNA